MDNLRVCIAIFVLSVLWINSSSAHVNLLAPVGGESFVSDEIVIISWDVEIVHEPLGFDVFFSPDSGETWQKVISLDVDAVDYEWTVPTIDTEQGMIRIFQDNVDMDYEDISLSFRISVVTALDDLDGNPERFELRANYPNPFQSVTTLEFALPHPNHVSLEIYSVQGVKVATLIDGVLSAGQYATTWDATGTKPGLYLVRVQAGTFVETRKLLKLE